MIIKYAGELWRKLSNKKLLSNTFKHRKLTDIPLLSIDLELTGLNPDIAQVTSIGWVSGTLPNINLTQAHYQIVRTSSDLQQSPVIHKLCAKEIAQGQHIREQIVLLEQLTKSHVWVFHNANLDVSVLNNIWKALDFPVTPITTIDTMLLQAYVEKKSNGFIPSGSVTLANSRKFYNLSAAPEHNALDDALATLTLLYAQIYHLDKQGMLSLKQLSHTKAINTFTLGG